MKPLDSTAIQEVLILLKEFGNFKHLKLIFVFSEKAFLVHQMLLKQKLNEKIHYLCDTKKLYFDKFNVKDLYKGHSNRKTKLFFFKSNKMLKELEFEKKTS
jgi:hypothetical protein